MSEFDMLPFMLDISPDHMRVTLNIPQESFNDPENSTILDKIYEVLAGQGIIFGIDDNAIRNYVSSKKGDRKVLIASGIDSVAGKPGKIDYFFDPSRNLAPKSNERGVVDFKDLGFVHNIVEGTIIANITPPSEGEAGKNIFGEEIPAKPGTPAKFRIGKNTDLTEDESQILATKDGNLMWDGTSFVIEETLVINQNIGVATGNVDFIGDVVIKGPVDENFTVISKKNIQISGSVVGATIIADGDITIALGAIRSNIRAKGNVKINFCENSTIECNGNLFATSFMSCNILCLGYISAVSGKGAIVGGKITAVEGIQANIVGSESYTKTSIVLGNGAILMDEHHNLTDKIEGLTDQIVKLEQNAKMLSDQKKRVGSLSPERETMLSSSIRNRFTYMREIKQYEKRVREIEKQLSEDIDVRLVAKKHLWPAVNISIGSLSRECREHYQNHKAYIDPDVGDIVFMP